MYHVSTAIDVIRNIEYDEHHERNDYSVESYDHGVHDDPQFDDEGDHGEQEDVDYLEHPHGITLDVTI